MMLSAKAKRIVTEAVASLPDSAARETWRAFATAHRETIPSDVADIALRALEAARRDVTARLKRHGLDDDERADLGNDLNFIRAVEGDLRKQRSQEQAAQ